MPRYTWETGEALSISLRIANYSREALTAAPCWTLIGDGVSLRGALPSCTASFGALTACGDIRVFLPPLTAPTELTLTVTFGQHSNRYPL